MQAKSPPRMQVVKREDKEQKLTSFILEHLDRLAGERLLTSGHELLLVALSTNSPVIGALKAATKARDLSGLHLRLILASLKDKELQLELSDLPPTSVSWACNAKLLDAHEQLVVSGSACWTGDCMRREPTKRDAFECFADDCEETAAWAHTSFERLWSASTPIIDARTEAGELTVDETIVADHVVAADSTTITGTLH